MNAMKIDWSKVDVDKIKKVPKFIYHGDSDSTIN